MLCETSGRIGRLLTEVLDGARAVDSAFRTILKISGVKLVIIKSDLLRSLLLNDLVGDTGSIVGS